MLFTSVPEPTSNSNYRTLHLQLVIFAINYRFFSGILGDAGARQTLARHAKPIPTLEEESLRNAATVYKRHAHARQSGRTHNRKTSQQISAGDGGCGCSYPVTPPSCAIMLNAGYKAHYLHLRLHRTSGL